MISNNDDHVMPEALNFSELAVGDSLPSFQFGSVSRHTLALYCGGSGDHNPIHVDSDFAKDAGHKDVFAHNMLSMAIVGRMLTRWTKQENINSFSVRFIAITHIHDEVTASATIIDKAIEDGEQVLRLKIETTTQTGTTTLSGKAVSRVP